IKYSAYGIPFALPAGDTDSDGDCDSTDVGQILTWKNAGHYDVRGDLDLDGDVDATDRSTAIANFQGTTLGWGVLSNVGNRKGYAGYERDINIGNLWHVRNRVYNAELGRWNSRDSLGYVDSQNLYGYVGSMPITQADASGDTFGGDNTTTPWLGWEFVSGSGPKNHTYLDGSSMVLQMRSHEFIVNLQKEHANKLSDKCKIECLPDSYSFSNYYTATWNDFLFPGKYPAGYLIFFLGSYELYGWVSEIDCCNGEANVAILVFNRTSLGSAATWPIGKSAIQEAWHAGMDQLANPPYLDAPSVHLPLQTTSQKIFWHEKVHFKPILACCPSPYDLPHPGPVTPPSDPPGDPGSPPGFPFSPTYPRNFQPPLPPITESPWYIESMKRKNANYIDINTVGLAFPSFG
ncbi:MAG: hypothetical protein HY286_19760, partial [Planctomycetes bacterium]|nr:hypothetical protein [Planctomycetota bacterium]